VVFGVMRSTPLDVFYSSSNVGRTINCAASQLGWMQSDHQANAQWHRAHRRPFMPSVCSRFTALIQFNERVERVFGLISLPSIGFRTV
jgi:hypothetical protein